MYTRQLNIPKQHSFFLFGARGTGKTTLVEHRLKGKIALFINLLDPKSQRSYEQNPSRLSEQIAQLSGGKQWICIDEIQRVPALLDLVHYHIEKDKIPFALTGSSARKLRRGAANLLAGRAYALHLHPLTFKELGSDFSLEQALAWGTLPSAWTTADLTERALYLDTYTTTYLQEEIIAEQVVRKLPPFRRFLEVAAQANTQIINYSKIANDVGSDHNSVKSYFQILEDTLVGFHLDPFHESVRKRQRQNPKFYWFDLGVLRSLTYALGSELRPGTYDYGRHFESFVINEIKRRIDYSAKRARLSYLRTKDDAEIDLIIERGGEPRLLIEIKSTEEVFSSDLGAFSRLAGDFPNSRAYCLYRGQDARKINGIELLPWEEGLEELVGGK